MKRCHKKNDNEPATVEELVGELDALVVLGVAVIVHAVARRDGTSAGSFPCPRCRTGTLRFSVASNNHARGVCDRVVGKNEDGSDVHCVSFIQ